MRQIDSPGPGENRMTPSRLQAPGPCGNATSQRLRTLPPLRETVLSFPSAKNASDFPSPDQNGRDAPSVPARGTGTADSSERTQSPVNLFVRAKNAILLPSGDTAKNV